MPELQVYHPDGSEEIFDIADYHENQADRCYHCKNELFARVEEVARRFKRHTAGVSK